MRITSLAHLIRHWPESVLPAQRSRRGKASHARAEVAASMMQRLVSSFRGRTGCSCLPLLGMDPASATSHSGEKAVKMACVQKAKNMGTWRIVSLVIHVFRAGSNQSLATASGAKFAEAVLFLLNSAAPHAPHAEARDFVLVWTLPASPATLRTSTSLWPSG